MFSGVKQRIIDYKCSDLYRIESESKDLDSSDVTGLETDYRLRILGKQIVKIEFAVGLRHAKDFSNAIGEALSLLALCPH